MSGDAPARDPSDYRDGLLGTDARGFAGGGLLRLLLAWLVPSTCAGCGMGRTEAGGAGACQRCWHSIRELDPACGCPSCALPGPFGPCRDCRDTPPPVGRAAAFGTYEGSLKRLVGAYKFRGFDILAAPFADRLASVARRARLDVGAAAIVPVPSTRSRNRERGFDPACLLARETGRRLGVPVVRPLRRLRETPPQSTLPKAERRSNVAGAFLSEAPPAGRLLLLDDVVTTGATAFAAADALLGAGAARVDLLVLARTPSPAESNLLELS